jgi:hypothetical protein
MIKCDNFENKIKAQINEFVIDFDWTQQFFMHKHLHFTVKVQEKLMNQCK